MKWGLLVVAVSLLGGSPPDPKSEVAGNWEWKEHRRGPRKQLEFVLHVEVRGSKVSGVYGLAEYINGEWQGQDGNQTPFAGTLRGAVATVEFDQENIHPGYEENVKYVRPSSGRPQSATIRRVGAQLQWQLESGYRIGGARGTDDGLFPVTMLLNP